MTVVFRAGHKSVSFSVIPDEHPICFFYSHPHPTLYTKKKKILWLISELPSRAITFCIFSTHFLWLTARLIVCYIKMHEEVSWITRCCVWRATSYFSFIVQLYNCIYTSDHSLVVYNVFTWKPMCVCDYYHVLIDNVYLFE